MNKTLSNKILRQLKDAGFPETQEEKDFFAGDDTGYINKGDYLGEPTLSELIEACGDIILFKLPEENEWGSESNGKWVAAPSSCYKNSEYLCADSHFIDTSLRNEEVGKTPEEAVARLWLELNKRPILVDTDGFLANTRDDYISGKEEFDTIDSIIEHSIKEYMDEVMSKLKDR